MTGGFNSIEKIRIILEGLKGKTASLLSAAAKAYRLICTISGARILRYHHSMKNIVLLENYYNPNELENQIGLFVDYYNNHRYQEALNNLTPD
jgi:hypothetical protein